MAEPKLLLYGLNDRPPFREAAFAALQHLLAIFVAIITPALIISSALKFDVPTTGYLVSMSLFMSGVSTYIQSHRIGPIGTGLLCIQGTSFSFISPIISAGIFGDGQWQDGCVARTELYLRWLLRGIGCRDGGESYVAICT